MLSSVLNSDRSIAVNLIIMRTFVTLRQLSSRNKEIVRRLSEMEKKYDAQFRQVFRAIRRLMEPEPVRRPMGFLSRPRKSL
jgi:phosphate uptake regulator